MAGRMAKRLACTGQAGSRLAGSEPAGSLVAEERQCQLGPGSDPISIVSSGAKHEGLSVNLRR